MLQFIDGDFVVNNGGWQWVVLIGIDVVFYFCIFNFMIQGERFDCDGEFICQWLLVLCDISGKVIYELWWWVEKVGVVFDYFWFIVEYKQVRIVMFFVYEVVRKGV